jgi:tetratricopeptide (TPR) repeat protein
MVTRPAPSERDKKRFQRALKAHEEGQYNEALQLFNKVRKSWGDDPDIWYLMSLSHGKMGQIKDVARVARNALKMDPNHYGALCSLANAQIALDDMDGALENYKKSLSINPDEPTVLDNYGRTLGALGRYDEAIEHFNTILKRNPDYAPAHASLAKAYNEGGRPQEAFDEYQIALQIDNRLADAHLGIAHLYTGLGELVRGEYHYNEAIRLYPDFTNAYIGLANVHRHRGHFDKALKVCERAEKISPHDPYILASKADTLQRMGNEEGAYKLLSALNEQNQMAPLAVDTFTRICRKFEVCDEAMELLELSIAAPSTDIMEKQMLRYAAGSLLDKQKRYDEAFEYFQSANEGGALAYNAENQRNIIEQVISHFSKEAMTSLPRAKTGSTRPIFILGMPRSGTTLTEQILSCHSDVYGAGELQYMKERTNEIKATQPSLDGMWATRMDKLTEAQMTGFANNYLDDISKLNSEAKHVTDKMPQNFMHIGLINLLFPEARIIHCRRNPLDNGLSIYFQNFLWSQTFANDLTSIGLYYNEYKRLMQHWEQVIDIPMLTVDYEEMIEDSEAMSKKILDFCEIEWQDSVMDFHNSKRAVATASFEQVRQPIYKTSKARWKNYEKHIGPLKDALSDPVTD